MFQQPMTIREDSDCARVFAVLSDGLWHTQREILDRTQGCTVHSRVSDLRLKHGCSVEWEKIPGQRRGSSRYRMVATPSLMVTVAPIVESDDGSLRLFE